MKTTGAAPLPTTSMLVHPAPVTLAGTGTLSETGALREPPSLPARAEPSNSVLAVPARRNKALFRFALSISVLNVVGHLVLGFEQAPVVPICAVLVAYVVNLALEWVDAKACGRTPGYRGGPRALMYFLLPAHIAALACSMLLYADNLWPYLFATVLAISSKYIVRINVGGRLRHFLNPSNFAIAVTLMLMPLVGFTPPYMFLNNTDGPVDVLIPLGVVIAGTMLNAKLTGKMPLILAWLGGYVAQAVLRTVLFDDVLLATLGMMTGVAFVLFTNYMITDPSTTPVGIRGQVVFGLSTALVYGALISAGVAYAIFFALTLVCAGRGVGMWFSARRLRQAAQTVPVQPPVAAH